MSCAPRSCKLNWSEATICQSSWAARFSCIRVARAHEPAPNLRHPAPIARQISVDKIEIPRQFGHPKLPLTALKLSWSRQEFIFESLPLYGSDRYPHQAMRFKSQIRNVNTFASRYLRVHAIEDADVRKSFVPLWPRLARSRGAV
jgi:hypothetical protein